MPTKNEAENKLSTKIKSKSNYWIKYVRLSTKLKSKSKHWIKYVRKQYIHKNNTLAKKEPENKCSLKKSKRNSRSVK